MKDLNYILTLFTKESSSLDQWSETFWLLFGILCFQRFASALHDMRICSRRLSCSSLKTKAYSLFSKVASSIVLWRRCTGRSGFHWSLGWCASCCTGRSSFHWSFWLLYGINEQARITMFLHTARGFKLATNQVANKDWLVSASACIGWEPNVDSNWTCKVDMMSEITTAEILYLD